MFVCDDFLTFVLVLEIISFCLYVLAGSYSLDNSFKISDASVKYLIPGLIGSAFILFGIALLYGFSGTVSFTEFYLFYRYMHTVSLNFSFLSNNLVVLNVAVGFILIGFFFKLSVFPFHYQLIS